MHSQLNKEERIRKQCLHENITTYAALTAHAIHERNTLLSQATREVRLKYPFLILERTNDGQLPRMPRARFIRFVAEQRGDT